MNTQEVQNILGIAGTVGDSLHREAIDVENMLISKGEQLERMHEVCRRMKEIKTVVLYHYDEHGMDAEEFILTMGNTLLSLAKTVCRLEAKRDALNLCRDNLNAVVRAANRFANKLPAIPKMED